jgi:two-component system nitrogen regulation response regulator NtrX
MSLNAQAKVLRVIQEMKLERIGGEESIEVDVRIVAATNKDLKTEIQAKRFREDLFFRLNVIPIHVPTLAERREDIPELIGYFLDKYGNPRGKGEKKRFSPEGIELLKAYSWPGNIRELKNFIERITIMSEEITISADTVRHYLGSDTVDQGWDSLQDYSELKLNDAKDLFEKRLLEKKLAENDNVISKTAEALGIYPSNLHNKLKKLGIKIEK